MQQHIFFWDTIQLGSKHAHWFYENGYQHFLLPEDIDSGHPPTFGLYLVALWMIFGKSLPVSHWAMLPFLWFNLVLVYQIGNYYNTIAKPSSPQPSPFIAIFLLLLFVADPVVEGQSILVSPDLVLLTFFFMLFYGILKNNTTLKTIGATGLAMISMRGMMVALMLYLFDLSSYFLKEYELNKLSKFASSNLGLKFHLLIKKAFPFIPGGLFALIFFIYHYQQTGWIGYHEASPWRPSFEKVGIAGFIKNVAILGWRMLEFGRFFIGIGIGIMLCLVPLKALWKDFYFKQLLMLLVLGFLVLSPSILLHQHLSAPRYLLPIFMTWTLIFFYLFLKIKETFPKWATSIFIIVGLGLFLGNWIYPSQLSRAWDSTIAHLPYYNIRQQAIGYIETKGIPHAQIGTAFPEIGPFKFKDLSTDTIGFSKKNLNEQNYILYSNIMNDFSEEEIFVLKKDWKAQKVFHSCGIYFILYQK